MIGKTAANICLNEMAREFEGIKFIVFGFVSKPADWKRIFFIATSLIAKLFPQIHPTPQNQISSNA